MKRLIIIINIKTKEKPWNVLNEWYIIQISMIISITIKFFSLETNNKYGYLYWMYEFPKLGLKIFLLIRTSKQKMKRKDIHLSLY